MAVIAEIKRGSPSKGLFAPNLDIPSQVKRYRDAGARAVSVLTDEKFFYGGIEDLKAVRRLVQLPILMKDFIIDEIQIDLAKSSGADIILLILAAHSRERLRELLTYALALELEVLLEVHDREELDFALSLKHPLIGVNNRNLKTFKTSLTTSLEMIQGISKPGLHMISESGIKSPGEVAALFKAGFRGVLIGESLIRGGETLLAEISKIGGELQ